MTDAQHEEIVEVKPEDGLVLAGLVIRPDEVPRGRAAVVWVHGAGVNFYAPTFLRIGRDLARRGFLFVTGNNRGHDFGTPLGWVGNDAIRGGVGWEGFEQSPLDIRAWINLMDELRAQGVALIGHSLGAAKVTYYQAHAQDMRVLGLGIASTRIRVGVDPALASFKGAGSFRTSQVHAARPEGFQRSRSALSS
jgi:pimeloyl-ACP methyl ester carboxylesterase